MRLLRFFAPDGNIHLGVRQDKQVRDLGIREPLEPIDAAELAAASSLSASALRLDAPIRSVPKLLALAGNYRKHVVESGFSTPANGVWTPQIFWKPTTAILASGGKVALRNNNVFFDWEAELAVVIGRRAKDVSVADAMGCVFGYTVINDLSERSFNARIEHRDKREFDPFFDWLIGKWFDGSAPLGPEIVTADEIPDPHNLDIHLSLNGERMQDSNTSHMIFSVPETIAAISAVLTLEPGDVIAMGTPEGIGFACGRALCPGDHLQAEIEKIGILDTFVVEEAQK
ncbi:MAG: fumarylacetoacetate hydrolase family protein [Terracidiphilus sp.]|nr:fumarylacetoacetate hydrolase family protein [Terracidiphilus sp.]